MPTDIPATKPAPTFKTTVEGIIALTLVAFFVFGAAFGFALSRVIGL